MEEITSETWKMNSNYSSKYSEKREFQAEEKEYAKATKHERCIQKVHCGHYVEKQWQKSW